MDLQEESDRFVVRADVPGVELKDIEVSAEDGTLTIRGERLAKEHVKSDGFEHVERVAGRFLRRFILPDSARAEAIKARYTDGVLEIEIPSSLESDQANCGNGQLKSGNSMQPQKVGPMADTVMWSATGL